MYIISAFLFLLAVILLFCVYYSGDDSDPIIGFTAGVMLFILLSASVLLLNFNNASKKYKSLMLRNGLIEYSKTGNIVLVDSTILSKEIFEEYIR